MFQILSRRIGMTMCCYLAIVVCGGCSNSGNGVAPSKTSTQLVDEINACLASGDIARAKQLNAELELLQGRAPLDEVENSATASVGGETPHSHVQEIRTAETSESPATIDGNLEQRDLQSKFDKATDDLYLLFSLAFGQAKTGQLTSSEFANAAINLAGTQLTLTRQAEEYNRTHPLSPLTISDRHRWYQQVDHLVDEIIPRR